MLELALVNKIQELTALEVLRSSVFPLRMWTLRLRTEPAIQHWSSLWCKTSLPPTSWVSCDLTRKGNTFLSMVMCLGLFLNPQDSAPCGKLSDFPHAISFLGKAFFMQYQLRRVLGVWTVPAWTHWTLGTILFQELCRETHYSVSLDCGNKYPVKQRKALSALRTFLKSKKRRWRLKRKWNCDASRVAEAWRSRGEILNFQTSPCPATSLASSPLVVAIHWVSSSLLFTNIPCYWAPSALWLYS